MSHCLFTAFGRLRTRARAYLDEEAGSATVWNITWLLVFAGMAGLSIDSSNGYRNKAIMQATADASAHAAVIQLPDQDAARLTAGEYAEKNMPATIHGPVLDTDTDVIFGHWDAETPDVTPYTARWTPVDENGALPEGMEVDAVRVMLRRTRSSGNPLPTQVLGIVGLEAWDVQTQAIAVKKILDNCYNKGLLTKGRFASQSNNEWRDGICIYAEDYLQFGSDVYGDDNIVIQSDDASDPLLLGSSGTGIFPSSNTDSAIQTFRDEHMTIAPLNVSLPDKIPSLYDTLKTWSVGDPWPEAFYLPFTPTKVEVVESGSVENPVAGTVYISDSSIVFKKGNENSNATLANVAAISGDTISIDSSIGRVHSVFMLAHKHDSSGAHQGVIDINSGTQIGNASYCTDRSGWSRFLASKDLKVGSNSQIAGAQFVAGLNLYLGSDGVSTSGIAAQVGSTYYAENNDPKIEPASNSVYGGCNAHFIPGSEVIALKY